MHELSIAMSIIDLVEEEAERQGGACVKGIHLRIGSLSGVVKDSLISCYEVASEQTQLAGSTLFIEDVPGVIYCPTCSANRAVGPVEWFVCPVCSSLPCEIVQGKELELIWLEVE